MSGQRPKFPIYIQIFAWFFILLIYALPAYALVTQLNKGQTDSSLIVYITLWMVGAPICFLLAHRHCSSKQFTYWDGFLWVTSCMLTGWGSSTIFFTIPALIIVFFLSTLMTLYNICRGQRTESHRQFLKIIEFFHNNRVRQ
jgi:hypothetical protein